LDKPVQAVHRKATLPVEREDWRGVSAGEHERRLEERRLTERARGLDLTRPPLMRLGLYRTGEADFRLLWCYHHLLVDGWSSRLVLRGFFLRYEATRRTRALPLPPARPFRAFVAWLQKQDRAEAEAFWKGELADFAEPTPVGGRPRPAGAEVDPRFGEE